MQQTDQSQQSTIQSYNYQSCQFESFSQSIIIYINSQFMRSQSDTLSRSNSKRLFSQKIDFQFKLILNQFQFSWATPSPLQNAYSIQKSFFEACQTIIGLHQIQGKQLIFTMNKKILIALQKNQNKILLNGNDDKQKLNKTEIQQLKKKRIQIQLLEKHSTQFFQRSILGFVSRYKVKPLFIIIQYYKNLLSFLIKQNLLSYQNSQNIIADLSQFYEKNSNQNAINIEIGEHNNIQEKQKNQGFSQRQIIRIVKKDIRQMEKKSQNIGLNNTVQNQGKYQINSLANQSQFNIPENQQKQSQRNQVLGKSHQSNNSSDLKQLHNSGYIFEYVDEIQEPYNSQEQNQRPFTFYKPQRNNSPKIKQFDQFNYNQIQKLQNPNQLLDPLANEKISVSADQNKFSFLKRVLLPQQKLFSLQQDWIRRYDLPYYINCLFNMRIHLVLPINTVYIAVQYIDSSLRDNLALRISIEKITTCALFMAAKIQSSQHFYINKFISILNMSHKEIRQLQWEIQKPVFKYRNNFIKGTIYSIITQLVYKIQHFRIQFDKKQIPLIEFQGLIYQDLEAMIKALTTQGYNLKVPKQYIGLSLIYICLYKHMTPSKRANLNIPFQQFIRKTCEEPKFVYQLAKLILPIFEILNKSQYYTNTFPQNVSLHDFQTTVKICY